MPAFTPEQASFLLNFYLPTLEREHQTTKRVIAAIPADQCGYAPHPTNMTALDLAWHIAAAECMFLDGVATGTFDFSNNKRPETVLNSAQVLEWYDAGFASAMERLRALSAEDAAKEVDFRGVFILPAVTFLHLSTNHGIHHRGQLSAYLRPMGAKVPAIYGGSADESFQAAQQARA